jgi:RHS repeat-associated protein
MYLVNSSQTQAAAYWYDPFGNLIGSSGSLATANVYRFSSKESHLADSFGSPPLYYYGYRFYDPSLQRWINRDPIGEIGGINLYRFVQNSPVAHTDAYGLIMDACQAAKEALAKASDYWAKHPDDAGAAIAQAAAYSAMIAACGPLGPPPSPPVLCPAPAASRPIYRPYGGNPGSNRTFCQNHPWACGGIAVGIGVGVACLVQPELCAGAVEIGIVILRSGAPIVAGAAVEVGAGL